MAKAEQAGGGTNGGSGGTNGGGGGSGGTNGGGSGGGTNGGTSARKNDSSARRGGSGAADPKMVDAIRAVAAAIQQSNKTVAAAASDLRREVTSVATAATNAASTASKIETRIESDPTLPLAREALEDIAAYMPTAAGTGGLSTRGSTSSSPRSSAALQQLVDSALTDVLGRRLRVEDAKAFVSSLERAFPAVEVDGKVTYRWTPRAYAVQVDLGADITGGQASFYHRARLAVDDAITLLEGLKPITPDPNTSKVEALRGVIREGLGELAEEAGREGGPRVQRMDHLFGVLFDRLRRLKEACGYEDEDNRAITVEQERFPTDYETIVGHVEGLHSTWNATNGLRARLTRRGAGGDKFLGTQFVLLQRAISVVAESVDEVYQAMDSVMLGPAERQVLDIPLPGTDDMPVEDLLSWVRDAATEEWPELIRTSGRVGVAAINPAAEQLGRFVRGAADLARGRRSSVPAALTRPRVSRALDELARQLQKVADLTRELLLGTERVDVTTLPADAHIGNGLAAPGAVPAGGLSTSS